MSLTCSRCGRPRESDQYKRCERCRELARIYAAKYYHANRDVILARLKQRDRKKLVEQQRTWRTENPEKIYESTKKWRQSNPEKIRKIRKEHQLLNRKQYNIYQQNRRSRIKGNGGTFTLEELNSLFEEQEGFCFYCGELLYSSFEATVHIEHKTPISRGGSNDIENIALSCARCNVNKGAKTVEEFLMVNKRC
jgi:5-methylcytosine-specific restriction endonuclease McrA